MDRVVIKKWGASIFLAFVAAIMGCKSGPFNLIKPATPHEQYARKLVSAGLERSAIGAAWLNTAEQSLQRPLAISLPYHEKGYFAADKVEAATFRFKLLQGEKLNISLSAKPSVGFRIYLDLWTFNTDGSLKFVSAADTVGNGIELAIDKTADYLLRVQPELLAAGSYTLILADGPSLGPPLRSLKRSQIQSFYGAGRDDNTRKHEGVDIFAAFRTPVVAAASGTVTGVNTNNLGGKVVWLRPAQKPYTLYYAHLDEQLVGEGQQVQAGDTLGLVGNTGNARTTPPHLHFGIYTNGGAVDPLPFIDPTIPEIPRINVAEPALNATMRTRSKTTIAGQSYPIGSVLRIDAVTGNNYRVALPDGSKDYISAKLLSAVTAPLSVYRAKTSEAVYDQPADSAAVKLALQPGQKVEVLGNFNHFKLIRSADQQTGWIRE